MSLGYEKTPAVVIDTRLRRLEVASSRAVWALADLQPRNARAEPTLLEFGEIDRAQHDASGDMVFN